MDAHGRVAMGQALTYADYVVDSLRADIVGGAYAPRAKLTMKELCARYQVGLSPIREALHRLAGEGFVHAVGQRGFTVPPLDAADLQDLTALRELVDEAAMRQALTRGGDAWEAGIVAAFHRLEREVGRIGVTRSDAIRRYDAVHRAFHVALYERVVSPRLSALHANLFDQAFRYRKSLHGPALSPQSVLTEHRLLMDSALSRDVDAAVAAARGHLQLTRAALVNAFDANASAHQEHTQ